MSAKADKVSSPVRGTGGQVDEMVLALIEAASDKDANVREVVVSSLCGLGLKQPALVLSSCNSYLIRQSKLSPGHRTALLCAMERIIKQTIDVIDNELAVDIIKQASAELTQSKDIIPQWQTAACTVLVALGRNFCNDVMRELLEKFQPGVLPHFFVVQTLANLATANVFGMVPFIKVCLGTTLPILGMAKQDNMRWVLTTAVSKFCEAIAEYMANISTAPDPTLKIDSFSGEVFSAWEIFFNVWLTSKEPKLRVAIVEALGHMSFILSSTRLQECLPRVIPTILGLYKKHADQPYVITEGLCMIMDAATESEPQVLEPYFDAIVGTLFAQICQPIDYRVPASVKNHNELLRCFAVLAKVLSNKLIAVLLQKLEQSNKDEKLRIAVLTVIRHLVNAAGKTLEDKQDLLLSGMKLVLPDPSNKVKKILSQTVIAMGHHGYLEMEGGHLMIEFIIKQCSLPPDPNKRPPADPDYVSNEMLCSMCENVLQLLSTTVDNMDTVLWPYLLEFLVVSEYTDSLGVVCRCIHNIASRKRSTGDEDYNINFNIQVNLPKPHEMLARLIVVVGSPLRGHDRGIHVLNAMQSLGPLIFAGLEDLWDSVIPKLCNYLEEYQQSSREWSQKAWEDLILKLLSKSLDHIKDETWFAECGDAFVKHMPLYVNLVQEKTFLFKCMGALMRKMTKKEAVNKLLDALFGNVKHSLPQEREGCAVTTGFVAGSHLDLVLSKLESVGKMGAKKSTSFLDFFKDTVNDTDEKMKATLMLCYGYVTLFAPSELVTSRLEANILHCVIPQLTSVKDRVIKLNLIRAVELIAQSMHPDHLKINFSFTQRNALLQHMKNYIKADSTMSLTTEIRASALDACSRLVKLDPKLVEADVQDLVKTGLSGVLTCVPEDNSVEHYDVLLERTVSALCDLLHEIFVKDMSVVTFDLLLQHLYVYIKSRQYYERQRSLFITANLLTVFLDNADVIRKQDCHLDTLSRLLAWIILRCCDDNQTVAAMAFTCFETMWCIYLKFEGVTDMSKNKDSAQLAKLKVTMAEREGTGKFLDAMSYDMSKVVVSKLQTDQLSIFWDTMFDGLLENDLHTVDCCHFVLTHSIGLRGSECSAQLEDLLSSLLNKTSKLTPSQNGFMLAAAVVRYFASHHLLKVIAFLLDQPLPWSDLIVRVWYELGQCKELSPATIDHLLDILSRSQPYEEISGVDSKTKKPFRRALYMPFTVVCALKDIVPTKEDTQLKRANVPAVNKYERLFVALLTQSAALIGTKPPKIPDKQGDEKDMKRLKSLFTSSELKVLPGEVAVEGLRRATEVCSSEDFISDLNSEKVWQQLQGEDEYWKGYSTLARKLAEQKPRSIPGLISHLNPVLSSLYYPQRVMATAVFAELIGQCCGGDKTLVEMLANSLLGRLVDQELNVRMLCVRGLGNIAYSGPEQVQKFCTMVLSALMAGMDDKDDVDNVITLEAMSGLSKILMQVSEKDIQPILINVALRIRPCFEKENCEVRAAAFTLFGNLAAFGSGASKEQFLEQIHTNFVSLLLHLNDSDNPVRQACKSALRAIGPLLGSEAANGMFQNHLIEGAILHYGEFINDFSKVIIRDFSTKLDNYVTSSVVFFKSQWSEMRSNAACLVGFLVGNMTPEQCNNISKHHICSALAMLLKDPEPDVRIRAAEAMSRLFNV